jgi:hypothetical protein
VRAPAVSHQSVPDPRRRGASTFANAVNADVEGTRSLWPAVISLVIAAAIAVLLVVLFYEEPQTVGERLATLPARP